MPHTHGPAGSPDGGQDSETACPFSVLKATETPTPKERPREPAASALPGLACIFKELPTNNYRANSAPPPKSSDTDTSFNSDVDSSIEHAKIRRRLVHRWKDQEALTFTDGCAGVPIKGHPSLIRIGIGQIRHFRGLIFVYYTTTS